MWYWVLVVLTGISGVPADVLVGKWGENPTIPRWFAAAVPYLVFMTALGLVIRIGQQNGYSLAVAVSLAVVFNIAGLVVWGYFTGTRVTGLQLLGFVFVAAAVLCFELGRPQQ